MKKNFRIEITMISNSQLAIIDQLSDILMSFQNRKNMGDWEDLAELEYPDGSKVGFQVEVGQTKTDIYGNEIS